MAISNLGTVNGLDASKLPVGYTPPVIATFNDYEYTRSLRLSVSQSTVSVASAATTMANILSNATVGINKQITDIITADYLTTPTVTAFAIMTNLDTNMNPNSTAGANTYLTNATVNYVADVILYIKAI